MPQRRILCRKLVHKKNPSRISTTVHQRLSRTTSRHLYSLSGHPSARALANCSVPADRPRDQCYLLQRSNLAVSRTRRRARSAMYGLFYFTAVASLDEVYGRNNLTVLRRLCRRQASQRASATAPPAGNGRKHARQVRATAYYTAVGKEVEFVLVIVVHYVFAAMTSRDRHI